MSRTAMTVPPSLFFATPIAGSLLVYGATSRILAASSIDDQTSVSLFTAICCGAFIFAAVWRAAAAWTSCQKQLKAQGKLLKYLCEKSPDIDENRGKAKELLAEIETD